MHPLKIYSTLPFEPKLFDHYNVSYKFELKYCFEHLSDLNLPEDGETQAICLFVSDHLDKNQLCALKKRGVQLILLRSKGFDNVDIHAAKELDITVLPTEYDSSSVVEHTIGLLIALARKFKLSFKQSYEGDFSLTHLVGMELSERVAGVIGTGKIGHKVATILLAMGMHVLAYDSHPDAELIRQGAHYVSLDTLLRLSDVITLHAPLTDDSHHLINAKTLSGMQKGALLVNTARGGLVDSQAVLEALESGQLQGFATDVYEGEAPFFFKKHHRPFKDDVLEKLLNHPNVLLTGHQGFLSDHSTQMLIRNCLENFSQWLRNQQTIQYAAQVS